MVQLQSNQHFYVNGKTQSGKSTLVKSLLIGYPRVLFHDRKFFETDWAKKNHYAVLHNPDEVANAIQKNAKRILYQPTDAGVEDFDAICEIIFRTGNFCLIIDESSSYCQHSQMPYFCGECLRLGASRGISVGSITQRARDVSNVLLSESSIVISFRAGMLTDRQKLIQSIGTHIQQVTYRQWRQMINKPLEEGKKPDVPVLVDDVLRTLPKYCYILYDSGDEFIHICAPVQLKG